MGFLDDEPVSSISVVRYGDEFGFLGFYIVHPSHQGKGIGLTTWKAGMAYLGGRTVGLDGVVDQQDNYRKSGFEYAGRNIRFQGPSQSIQSASINPVQVEPAKQENFNAINDFDRSFFPVDRSEFLKAWILPKPQTQRSSFVAFDTGRIVGLITVRRCIEGYKIGPLFADNRQIAMALMQKSTAGLSPSTVIVLDVPEQNKSALSLAQDFGFEPVFETARMYRGSVPNISTEKTFGITTFELG